ncbi:hypothetical protein B0H14DRAFT_2607579 [Mycena olivaceomarginata]|nr:hypothetical protein B0H14DRAFT_2607579 [Mycena olivaceomarginata]
MFSSYSHTSHPQKPTKKFIQIGEKSTKIKLSPVRHNPRRISVPVARNVREADCHIFEPGWWSLDSLDYSLNRWNGRHSKGGDIDLRARWCISRQRTGLVTPIPSVRFQSIHRDLYALPADFACSSSGDLEWSGAAEDTELDKNLMSTLPTSRLLLTM